jgi:hypothetical protein
MMSPGHPWPGKQVVENEIFNNLLARCDRADSLARNEKAGKHSRHEMQ